MTIFNKHYTVAEATQGLNKIVNNLQEALEYQSNKVLDAQDARLEAEANEANAKKETTHLMRVIKNVNALVQ